MAVDLLFCLALVDSEGSGVFALAGRLLRVVTLPHLTPHPLLLLLDLLHLMNDHFSSRHRYLSFGKRYVQRRSGGQCRRWVMAWYEWMDGVYIDI